MKSVVPELSPNMICNKAEESANRHSRTFPANRNKLSGTERPEETDRGVCQVRTSGSSNVGYIFLVSTGVFVFIRAEVPTLSSVSRTSGAEGQYRLY